MSDSAYPDGISTERKPRLRLTDLQRQEIELAIEHGTIGDTGLGHFPELFTYLLDRIEALEERLNEK